MAWAWLPGAVSELEARDLRLLPQRPRVHIALGSGLVLLLVGIALWSGARPAFAAGALILALAWGLAGKLLPISERWPRLHSTGAALVGAILAAAPAVASGRAASPLWLLFTLSGLWAALRHGPSWLVLTVLVGVPPAVGAIWQAVGIAPLAESVGPLLLASFGGSASYTFVASLSSMLIAARRDLALQTRRVALEGERRHIARELHTTLGASLTEIALWQQVANGSSGEARREALRKAEVRARGALDELGLSAAGLEAGDASSTSLGGILRERLDGLCAAGGVRLVLSVRGDARLAAPRAYHLLKIVEESALNAVKHGRARTLTVEIDPAGSLLARVHDDGAGFEPQTVLPGQGLQALRAHAGEMGARLELQSSPGHGTTVLVLGEAR